MITPFLSVTGGEDQEKTTSLSPATAVNPTGEPDGTEREMVFSKTAQSFYFACHQKDNGAHIE